MESPVFGSSFSVFILTVFSADKGFFFWIPGPAYLILGAAANRSGRLQRTQFASYRKRQPSSTPAADGKRRASHLPALCRGRAGRRRRRSSRRIACSRSLSESRLSRSVGAPLTDLNSVAACLSLGQTVLCEVAANSAVFRVMRVIHVMHVIWGVVVTRMTHKT